MPSLLFCLATLSALAMTATAASAAQRPVVVELFTSEGCSSCPPADAYLTELASGRPDVLALAFHVTYWNALGWRDPYSLEAASERQARYGTRFGDGSYTPEMVIDGRRGFNGTDRGAVGAAIEAAKRQQSDTAEIRLSEAAGRIEIRVGKGAGAGEVLLIGFDRRRSTTVGRGENSGRTLVESNIVRSIRRVGAWSGAPAAFTEARPAGEEIAIIIEAPDGHVLGAVRAGGNS